MELGITTETTIGNPVRGDLALDDAGLEVVRTTLADEVHQRLSVRFRFFRGEWFLNLLEGVPYYDDIMVKGPSDRLIRAVFTDVLTGTEGVTAVSSLTYNITRDRVLELSFVAQLEDGTTFSATEFNPFVLTA